MTTRFAIWDYVTGVVGASATASLRADARADDVLARHQALAHPTT
ncbi:hypothetical protein ACFUNF_19375 [Streptomyces sp. NPDC057291]